MELAIAGMVLAVVALFGCATKPEDSVQTANKTVNVDKRLLVECKELPKLEGPTDTQNVEFTKTLTSQYVECAKNNKALVNLTKDAFNIKDGQK
jgi:hypothetical protein